MSDNALCSAGSAAPTTLLFLQFARIRFQTFSHISETIGPIDLSVNALCSAGSAAPTTLFLSICTNTVLNILSYYRNYWANLPECQRVGSAGSAAPTTLLFLQFARIRFSTFCHITETIGQI